MALPTPQVGLVISYEYLWRNEAAAGQLYGKKSRPCAILLVIQRKGQDEPVVAVVPITHSLPPDLEAAIEIPLAVKQFLQLDSERSWIILDDFNVFPWPGFDLSPVPGNAGRYDYGLLPPRLFQTVIEKFTELRKRRPIPPTLRDDV